MELVTTGVSIFLFLFCVAMGFRLKQKKTVSRLNQMLEAQDDELSMADIIDTGETPTERLRRWLDRLSQTAFANIVPDVQDDEYGNLLTQAGEPINFSATQFYLLRVIAGVGFAFVLPAVGGYANITSVVTLGLAGLLVGFMGPLLWLRAKARERQEQIRQDVLIFVDMLAVVAEAGHTMHKAFERVSKEIGGVLGEETQRVFRRVQMGQDMKSALNTLRDRNNVDELRSFVNALRQQDLGGHLAPMLRVQSEQLRNTRKSQAEQAANKASVKILVPVIMFIFGPLFIILLGPALASLAEFL